MNLVKHLVGAQAGYQAILQVWAACKPYLIAGHRLELEIRPERRNTAQNALFHALLQEIAARVKWAGELRDVETWKRLVTAAWLRAEGESIQLLPSIDGKGLDVVYTPTSTLTKAQMASLVDFVSAWSVEQGIDISEAA